MSDEKRQAAGTVMLNLAYGESDLGDGETLTDWERNLLNSLRGLCQQGLDREDCVERGRGDAKAIGVIWMMRPGPGDIIDPADRFEKAPPETAEPVWATPFERVLLDDIRKMALEAVGR